MGLWPGLWPPKVMKNSSEGDGLQAVQWSFYIFQYQGGGQRTLARHHSL
jgi:hypothetical protein